MGKKNKRSSTSGDVPANTKKHKRSSTTDVDTAHVLSSKSSKNVGKSVLEPCSASKGNLKKQMSEEIKEMSKSIKEVKEALKKQEEILQTIADEQEGKDEDYCNFECKEAKEDRRRSIFVKGLDEDMGRRKDIKKALGDFFGSCGKIECIFVPIACQTGVPLGYAFITFEDWEGGNEKALKKNGEFLRGRQLEVKLAKDSGVLHGYYGAASKAVGCKRCVYRNRFPRRRYL